MRPMRRTVAACLLMAGLLGGACSTAEEKAAAESNRLRDYRALCREVLDAAEIPGDWTLLSIEDGLDPSGDPDRYPAVAGTDPSLLHGDGPACNFMRNVSVRYVDETYVPPDGEALPHPLMVRAKDPTRYVIFEDRGTVLYNKVPGAGEASPGTT